MTGCGAAVLMLVFAENVWNRTALWCLDPQQMQVLPADGSDLENLTSLLVNRIRAIVNEPTFGLRPPLSIRYWNSLGSSQSQQTSTQLWGTGIQFISLNSVNSFPLCEHSVDNYGIYHIGVYNFELANINTYVYACVLYDVQKAWWWPIETAETCISVE